MKIILNIIVLLLLVKLTSCIGTKAVQYVDGQFDTTRLKQYMVKDPVIQKGDLISIIIYSDNPEATALYNQPNVSGNVQASATPTGGYLVDDKGNIQLQGIGDLPVEGLTKKQLSELLDARLTKYLKNPYYNIRFLNFKITMIGEVTKEGVYSIPSERVNLLEAVALSGGMTLYADRTNVRIIRESNGKRDFARVDLTKPDVFQSPYYFLQQNDVIIVGQ